MTCNQSLCRSKLIYGLRKLADFGCSPLDATVKATPLLCTTHSPQVCLKTAGDCRRYSKLPLETTVMLNWPFFKKQNMCICSDIWVWSTHNWARKPITTVLFCSLAVLNPRVGHTTDVLSPFIPVLCHSEWLFHGESCPRLDVVHPGHAWPSSPSCTWHCSLH